MSGLRERLRERRLPTRTVPYPADREAWDAAHAELQQAAAAVHNARRRGAPPQEDLDREAEANAAVAALEVIEWVVRTLEPHDWEALKSEHPAQPDAEHGWDYDPAVFEPALLAEVVSVDGEQLSADEWTPAAVTWLSPGERQHLLNVAFELNTHVQVVSDAVGKGSATTRS